MAGGAILEALAARRQRDCRKPRRIIAGRACAHIGRLHAIKQLPTTIEETDPLGRAEPLVPIRGVEVAAELTHVDRYDAGGLCAVNQAEDATLTRQGAN